MKTLRERQRANEVFPFPVQQLFNLLDQIIPEPQPRMVITIGDRTAVDGPPKRRVYRASYLARMAQQQSDKKD